MTESKAVKREFVIGLEEPPISKSIFGHTRWAWLWLIVRLYVAWQWLQATFGKLGNPAWTGAEAGSAITGFVQGAMEKAQGPRPQVQVWYAWFLENLVLPNPEVWSYLVSIGEFLVGVALLLGVFTGIAAFFGFFMNMNYLLAGSISSNPILLLLSLLLILAWRTSGWWGIDRWLLPSLGTPWKPGLIFQSRRNHPDPESG